MTDASGSKTVVVLFGVVLAGVALHMAHMTRQDASARPGVATDATTRAQQVSETLRQVERHVGPMSSRGAAARGPRAPVANRALKEMKGLEQARRASEGDWRSRPGAPGRRDGWRP